MKFKWIIIVQLVFYSIALCHSDSTSTNKENFNSGIIYGKDHAFMLTAAKDWVLDNSSGVNQGLQAVFYPKDQTWANSPVIVYARAITKNKLVNSIEGQVKATIEDFKNNGSPDIKAMYIEDINLDNNKSAKIYYYTGDRWNNYEAAAYINEAKTIIFIISSARGKQIFEKSISSFHEIVKSYMFISEDIIIN